MSIFSRDFFKLSEEEIRLTQQYNRLTVFESIEEIINNSMNKENPLELFKLVKKHPFY